MQAYGRDRGRSSVRAQRGQAAQTSFRFELLAEEVEQEGVQLVGALDTDEVARALDHLEPRPGNGCGDMLGDREEVGLVPVADDDECRHRERLERWKVGPDDLRLLVRGLLLERASLLRPKLVAVLGRDPELEVQLRGAVEVAAVEELRLACPVLLDR